MAEERGCNTCEHRENTNIICPCIDCYNYSQYIAMGYTMPTGELSFTVVDDTIVEDTKITGSEY